MSPYLANQYVAFTRNVFEGRPNISRVSRPKRKSPSSGVNARRSCCHTKNRAEPGRYSQRITALPRSDCVRKSGLLIENAADGPVPSGSTLYESTFPPLVTGAIVLPEVP